MKSAPISYPSDYGYGQVVELVCVGELTGAKSGIPEQHCCGNQENSPRRA
jgi:hypothetical protein